MNHGREVYALEVGEGYDNRYLAYALEENRHVVGITTRLAKIVFHVCLSLSSS